MSDLIRTLVKVSGLALLGSGMTAATLHAAQPGKPERVAQAGKTANAELANPAVDGAAKKKGGQSIVVLVNDEPITAYEVEQRAAFLALQGGGGGPSQAEFKAKAEARWKAIIKDPKTNERFKEILKKNNVQTQEEARALQTKYVKDLQANMVAQLKREARGGNLAGSRGKAQEELIEEKIKLQEAKRLNAVSDDAEVDKILSGIAERNKMTLDQFGQHMKGMGVDIRTMRSRFKAEMSWREVVRRRFGHLVSITERDVDQVLAGTSMAAAQGDVELQVQRVTLPLPGAVDQTVIAQRIAEADALARQYKGCASLQELATSAGGKYEDLGSRKPATIPEPTRSLLLNASDGDLLPASVSQSGVELWALCGRKAETSVRETAQNELRQKEFEVLAQKALKDLRQDASIEIR